MNTEATKPTVCVCVCVKQKQKEKEKGLASIFFLASSPLSLSLCAVKETKAVFFFCCQNILTFHLHCYLLSPLPSKPTKKPDSLWYLEGRLHLLHHSWLLNWPFFFFLAEILFIYLIFDICGSVLRRTLLLLLSVQSRADNYGELLWFLRESRCNSQHHIWYFLPFFFFLSVLLSWICELESREINFWVEDCGFISRWFWFFWVLFEL